jgi:hypothetical protein
MDYGFYLQPYQLGRKIPPRSFIDMLYIREQFMALPIHLGVLAGLLLWKRIAVYGFFLLPLLQITCVNTILTPKPTFPETLLAGALGFMFVGITLATCWFFVIKSKWGLFE